MKILQELLMVKCICEPRGNHGLEGYLRDCTYKAVKCKDSKGIYWRVYPSDGTPDYYECCPDHAFKKYFAEK